MEESRYKSRVTIHDGVFDKIQQQRYNKHLKSLDHLRTLEGKSNSEYLLSKNFVQQLYKSKKARNFVHQLISPPDLQYKNCERRIRQIKQSTLKLPKISNIKLYENRRLELLEEGRVAKQNKILTSKIEHLSLQKGIRRKQLSKSIKEYQLYKRISSRSQLKIKPKQVR